MERALLFNICIRRLHFFDRRARLLKHETRLGAAWVESVHLAVMTVSELFDGGAPMHSIRLDVCMVEEK